MVKKTSIEIVIPIYNEEVELKENVIKLRSYLIDGLPDYKWKITIADNASTDRSLKIAKQLSKKYSDVNAVHLDKKGRGRAVKKVWMKSNADILAYMDVDLSTDLMSLRSLISALMTGYEVAIASRLLPKSRVINRPLKREILSRGYNILIKVFFQTSFSDAQCGFKAITKKAARSLLPCVTDDEWFFDSELLILADKIGYKIFEHPVKWIDNPGSTVRVLGTVKGDLIGLWRLFTMRPWAKINK